MFPRPSLPLSQSSFYFALFCIFVCSSFFACWTYPFTYYVLCRRRGARQRQAPTNSNAAPQAEPPRGDDSCASRGGSRVATTNQQTNKQQQTHSKQPRLKRSPRVATTAAHQEAAPARPPPTSKLTNNSKQTIKLRLKRSLPQNANQLHIKRRLPRGCPHNGGDGASSSAPMTTGEVGEVRVQMNKTGACGTHCHITHFLLRFASVIHTFIPLHLFCAVYFLSSFPSAAVIHR